MTRSHLNEKKIGSHRIADLDIKVGVHPRGRANHILDVSGGVGLIHYTRRDDEAGLCTGFTVIQPSPVVGRPRAAAVFAANGAGELTGRSQIDEWGYLETPIVMTNTPSVGRAYAGVSLWMMRRNKRIGFEDSVVIPVVGECDDSILNEPRHPAWDEEDVCDALSWSLEIAHLNESRVSEIPAEAFEQGSVGAGTGTIAYDLKAGIGSSSRVVLVDGKQMTVGVMLQCNFGTRDQLTIAGRRIGPSLKQPLPRAHREGSCFGVLATNAPLSPLGLQRLAKRMSLGLARTGCHAHHGSGEIFLAFSTAAESVHDLRWGNDEWNPLLQAAVEASEEAVYNALLSANPVANARASVAALSPGDVS